MKSNINSNEVNEHLYKLLYDLWASDEVYEDAAIYPYDFQIKEEELINTLFSDINIAISFLEYLDLNQKTDSYIRRYINPIIDNLKTQKEKEHFMEFIDILSEKYPDNEYICWKDYS